MSIFVTKNAEMLISSHERLPMEDEIVVIFRTAYPEIGTYREGNWYSLTQTKRTCTLSLIDTPEYWSEIPQFGIKG